MNSGKVRGYEQLNAGVTGEAVLEAIRRSGYPLQAEISNSLARQFTDLDLPAKIQEEWAYLDKETDSVRALDVFAEIYLNDSTESGCARSAFSPQLHMLIECKQSELPYVFFLRGTPPGTDAEFPELIGVEPDIKMFGRVENPDMPSDYSILMSTYDALAFHEFTIFDAPPFYAISLSKTARKGGSKLELTGEEAYRSLTLPLLKAADHLKKIIEGEEEKNGRSYCSFIAPIAVVDAPMIGVLLHEGRHLMVSLPWVRMSYLEPGSKRAAWGRTQSRVRHYDVVHKDFLEQYTRTLTHGVRSAAIRLEENSTVVKSGLGVFPEGEDYAIIPELEDWRLEYSDLEPIGRVGRQPSGSGITFDGGSSQCDESAILNIRVGESYE
ncbi:hypothetical protein AB0D14_16735 [Streptomyces sp. NPDC048484]|uniref:hypothetical protein n=1 Tax=Streptomyces sp. NPDC048484 TaxID=3155146 RepID=UPI003430F57B